MSLNIIENNSLKLNDYVTIILFVLRAIKRKDFIFFYILINLIYTIIKLNLSKISAGYVYFQTEHICLA